MNYIYLIIEIVFTFLLMFFFYKKEKKDGLYLYIGFMASIFSILMFKTIDIFSFQINLGIPVLMGIFMANNVIIHRYGLDEIKRIICTFGLFYIVTIIIISLASLGVSSEYNLLGSNAFDGLFGYDLGNLRLFVGGLISIPFIIWLNGEVYYYIRQNKNNIIFNNIISMLIVQFIESLIFILIGYMGIHDIVLIIGMVVIRYLVKVVIGIIGLCPVYLLAKMKDK